MSLCLVAIFKNEGHIINEFIKHYINQGVDHFFFIDNGSDDNYQETIQKYNNVTVRINPNRPYQRQHYNYYYLAVCKKFYDWVIVCDLDEFIYARRQFRTIKQYLNSLPNSISQVFVPWKMFGSSGFDTVDKKQPDSVVQNFTLRTNYNKNSNFQGVVEHNGDNYSFSKCIVRTKYLQSFDIHSHITTNRNYIGADNNRFIYENAYYKINEEILNNSYLHLNHYAIQSFDFFMRIKATRGAADQLCNENVRTEKYFRDYDDASNDITDNELKTLNSHL